MSSSGEEEVVTTFYTKLGGDFGIVRMHRNDKNQIEKLFNLLRKLDCITPVDRDHLLKTWKQHDRENVRWLGTK